MGIFVKTDKPLAVGTQLVLRFAPPALRRSPSCSAGSCNGSIRFARSAKT